METISKVVLIILVFSKVIGGGWFGSKHKGEVHNAYVVNTNGKNMKVAILPLENVSKDPNATKKVTWNLVTYLSGSGAYDVIEPGVVEKALVDLKVRALTEINADVAKKLGETLKCDALLLGIIMEYGDTRVGNDTYPVISLNLRLVDTQTASILWTSTLTKTGGEKSRSIFSASKSIPLETLMLSATKSLTQNMLKQKTKIYLAWNEHKKKEGETAVAEAGKSDPAATASGPVLSGIEGKKFTQDDLKGLLVDVEGYSKSEVIFKKLIHNRVETTYSKNSTLIRVEIVDYEDKEHATKLVSHYYEQGNEIKINGSLAAQTKPSPFEYLHLGVPFGQIGIYVGGSKKSEEDMKAFVKSLLEGIQSKAAS